MLAHAVEWSEEKTGSPSLGSPPSTWLISQKLVRKARIYKTTLTKNRHDMNWFANDTTPVVGTSGAFILHQALHFYSLWVFGGNPFCLRDYNGHLRIIWLNVSLWFLLEDSLPVNNSSTWITSMFAARELGMLVCFNKGKQSPTLS